MSSIHVAVAAIVNSQREVLIAQRPEHVHQGGLWEFPGGKVEHQESVTEALKREIHEELGLQIESMTPLIQVNHDYPDRSVFLDVWRIDDYRGEPTGMEGQAIRWLKINQLDMEDFPHANKPIIRALQLPDHYMITGEFRGLEDFHRRLARALGKGVRLVQLRTGPAIEKQDYLELAERARKLCERWHATLLLNASVDTFNQSNARGIHLNSRMLFDFDNRPIADDRLLSVSCHNQRELQQAHKISADMVLLSPVKPTTSHPGTPGIGWDEFSRLTRTMSCPVYALGGMQLHDVQEAIHAGAQGIAAITSLWTDE